MCICCFRSFKVRKEEVPPPPNDPWKGKDSYLIILHSDLDEGHVLYRLSIGKGVLYEDYNRLMRKLV
jgi:hypothetical protein